jgi:hypothetical protein
MPNESIWIFLSGDVGVVDRLRKKRKPSSVESMEHGKKKEEKKSNDVVSWAASVPPLLYGPPEANKWAPLINVPQLFLLRHQHWMMTLIFGFIPVPCCGVAGKRFGLPHKPMTNSNHGPSRKPWSSAYYFSFWCIKGRRRRKPGINKSTKMWAGVDAVAPMDADFSSGRWRGLVGRKKRPLPLIASPVADLFLFSHSFTIYRRLAHQKSLSSSSAIPLDVL